MCVLVWCRTSWLRGRCDILMVLDFMVLDLLRRGRPERLDLSLTELHLKRSAKGARRDWGGRPCLFVCVFFSFFHFCFFSFLGCSGLCLFLFAVWLVFVCLLVCFFGFSCLFVCLCVCVCVCVCVCALFGQCMHGAVNEKGIFVQKGTGFGSNIRWKKTALRCSGHNGVGHAHLQGQIF